jgi:hypothetical protein
MKISRSKASDSNELFFSTLRELIDRWCNERRLQPLSHVLPGYLAFNGWTDGWASLIAGLVDADPSAGLHDSGRLDGRTRHRSTISSAQPVSGWIIVNIQTGYNRRCSTSHSARLMVSPSGGVTVSTGSDAAERHAGV